MSFPKSFVWGAASASYQVEGGGVKGGQRDTVNGLV